MKRLLCSILSAVILFTAVLVTPVKAQAIEPISIAAGVITSMISTALSNYISDSANRSKYRQQMSQAFGNSAFDGVASVTGDDLWSAYAQLNSQHVPVEIHTFTYNGATYYGLMGKGIISYPDGSVLSGTGVDITNRWMQYTYLSGNVPMFLRVGSLQLPSNSYQSYNYNLLQSISSFVQGISAKLTTTNQKLDNLLSAITGQSAVVAEARSIIEQLSVFTSTSDLSNAAKQYWSRTFVDPSSNFSMVYVTYEDLSQLVLDLANIGVTTRIYYDEVKRVYVIRDVGAWIVDPNTRSDYYSSTAASDSSYHFYQHYFSLGRGQVICSTFPSLSLLLNDLNLRVVTVWNSIESANSRLLSISNHLGTISSHIVSLEDLLQSIVDYLESHGELDYQPPFYVRNISDSSQRYRIVPYVSMCQMLSDINVNYLGYPITDISVGEPVSLISSASMSASYTIAENDYYSLIIRYRNESGEDIVGRLCDENGNAFRAFQMDNYPFRILNKLDDIYNWLDSADLLTGEDIETMISITNNKVLQFLPFSNNFIQMVNNVFSFSPSLDWADMNNYLQTLGRDAE